MYRMSFDAYKSTVCHQVKDMGDLEFIIQTLESNKIRTLFEKKWYLESLYLLAMLDYLSRVNDISLCSNYSDIRAGKFAEPIYPSDIILLSVLLNSEEPKNQSLKEAIPEFIRHNIVESEVRNVC